MGQYPGNEHDRFHKGGNVMSSVLNIILFIVTVIMVMLIIQAYRIGRFLKEVEGDGYPIWSTMLVIMFKASQNSGGFFHYYLEVLSGRRLSDYEEVHMNRNMPEEDMSDEEYETIANRLEKDIHLIRTYFYPDIVKIMLTTSRNVKEFRVTVDGLLEQLEGTGKRHKFVVRVNEQLDEITVIENMSRDEVYAMFRHYVLGMDTNFIQRKIEEYNNN